MRLKKENVTNVADDKDITYFERVYARIATLVNGQNQANVAAALGIKQSSVSAAKKKASIPSDWYISLYDRYGVSIDWLRFGTPPMYVGKLPPLMPNLGVEEPPSSSFFEVPVYHTNVNREKTPIGYDKKEDILLPEKLREVANLIFYHQAKGMEPYILQHAIVGISTQNKSLISGEIFAFLSPLEGVIFRRVAIMEDEVLLCSEQQNIPPIPMSGEKFKSSLIGKVMWTIQGV